jgi:hypothetical protein
MTDSNLELLDVICEGMAILDYFNDAIIGYNMNTKQIIYDWELMVKILMNEHSLSEEQAIEYISFNVIPLKITNDGGVDITPIVFYKFDFEENEEQE